MKLLVANSIGYIAVVVGISIMVPQVLKIVKTKRANDVSLGTAKTYCVNCVLWLVYGILIAALPVIVGNALGLVVGVIQLFLIKRYTT